MRLHLVLRLLAVAAATSLGILTPGAASAPAGHQTRAAAISVTATIAKIDGGITVTVTNQSGSDSIRFLDIVMVATVHHTGASVDSGGTCGPGPKTPKSDVLCVFSTPFAAGTTHVVTILIDAVYPTNGGADIYASSTTPSALVLVGRATGPLGPCACTGLTARILPSSIKFTNPGETGGMHLEFTVAWKMTCGAGAGGCKGTLKLVAPQGADYKTHFKRPGAKIACNGACSKTAKGKKHFVLIGNRGLGGDRRGKKVEEIPIGIKRKCQGRNLPSQRLSFVFDKRTALVDKKKSTLR